ncbi:phosphoribosyl-AMP cyclohydrolase [bacterium (Candidatus Gribaldobacteria) CG08_land_8_20_14_0_20_39_15]|uniref:Histidine biosynthesis bifunctional protein HisIE n=1 Tax=bacterium (Candidatus Gribaldobacteria) CG08_land_8_20_14_0_20_39_15 TaxID=2014273 RepID=A0A2M6XUN4_9BACT|nr:MAG: phosphoribosyl-AMP cyclohydrolase [bacterium (Candidatus Gribaldobacteria) CG08_land_8_20_14_0_20_39_15]
MLKNLKKAVIKIKSEEELLKLIDWPKVGFLVPVIIQHYLTGNVLMLGFMNQEALQRTLQEGKITYYSRTRQTLWTKGETSGNFQFIKSLWLDCDNDTLLIKARQIGKVCHTGHKTCFYKKLIRPKACEINSKF